MKKAFLSLLSGCLLLTGCLETTQEITLRDDGTGLFSTTSDMGPLLTMAKQMGGGEQLEKAGEVAMDTTIGLGSQADSIPDLNETDKALLQKGRMNMKINLKNDEFKTRLEFPFSQPDEIPAFSQLTGKLMGNIMKSQMGESAMMDGMGGMPAFSSMDDYFNLEFSNGEFKKKLNKEKYATASSDEYLNGLKQASGMGLPVVTTYIINLPRPAEKVEGKNIQLSEDKRKVTIKAELDDFFEDPEKLEFKIKY